MKSLFNCGVPRRLLGIAKVKERQWSHHSGIRQGRTHPPAPSSLLGPLADSEAPCAPAQSEVIRAISRNPRQFGPFPAIAAVFAESRLREKKGTAFEQEGGGRSVQQRGRHGEGRADRQGGSKGSRAAA